jgi:hypothetical protein
MRCFDTSFDFSQEMIPGVLLVVGRQLNHPGIYHIQLLGCVFYLAHAKLALYTCVKPCNKSLDITNHC